MTLDSEEQQATIEQALRLYYQTAAQGGPENHRSVCMAAAVLGDVQEADIESDSKDEETTDAE